MKIGLSLSRCVRDIFEDKVSFNDVLVIVARTDVDPEIDRQWNSLWSGYAGDGSGSLWSQPEWYGFKDHEQDFRDICVNLKKKGKLHQPRQFGAWPPRLEHYWYDVILTPKNLEENAAAKKAWENYKLLAELTNK